ncbi:MAG: 6-phosphogluconolactonase [Bacteroidetes bacterium]|nr:6-phosphogluconolactonase [Bacteroidota bacterium]
MDYENVEGIMKRFESKELLEDSLAGELIIVLGEAIEKYGNATLVVSGGSTPKGLFKKLSERKIPWKNTTIGLVDERFVNNSSEYSNEKLIRETFLQREAYEATLIPMVFDDSNEEKNIDLVRKAYEKFDRIDAIILGMGDDGHTASIFPNDPSSVNALKTKELIVSTKAPNYPTHRITCSIDFLKRAERTFLFITGENKLQVLQESFDKNYPIAQFYNQNTDIYYSK